MIKISINTILSQEDVDKIQEYINDGATHFRMWRNNAKQINNKTWANEICVYKEHYFIDKYDVYTKYKPSAREYEATRWYLRDKLGLNI